MSLPCQLDLCFARSSAGRTRLAERRASYPYSITAPIAPPDGTAQLTLQSISGGLYGGENVSQHIRLRDGASARLMQPAATTVRRRAEAGPRGRASGWKPAPVRASSTPPAADHAAGRRFASGMGDHPVPRRAHHVLGWLCQPQPEGRKAGLVSHLPRHRPHAGGQTAGGGAHGCAWHRAGQRLSRSFRQFQRFRKILVPWHLAGSHPVSNIVGRLATIRTGITALPGEAASPSPSRRRMAAP